MHENLTLPHKNSLPYEVKVICLRLVLVCIKTKFLYFISVINQLDAQHFCFTISFISCLYILFHASTCFEHMCSKHVEAWSKLIVKQKFCASIWVITEINILRCTVSKTSNNYILYVIYFVHYLLSACLHAPLNKADVIINLLMLLCSAVSLLSREWFESYVR